MWSAVQARLCSDALQALRVEQEWAGNQVYFEEYRQKDEKRKQEEVRPDFAVCCAGVTVRRDYLAASQKGLQRPETFEKLSRRNFLKVSSTQTKQHGATPPLKQNQRQPT